MGYNTMISCRIGEFLGTERVTDPTTGQPMSKSQGEIERIKQLIFQMENR